MVLRKEADIRLTLAANRKTESLQIEIFPSGVLNFLLAASRADKEQIAQIFLGRHRCEEFR